MTEQNKTLLSRLIDLSKVDVSLARIKAEKRKLETELQGLHASMQKDENDRAQKQKLLDEKSTRYSKEEKRLKEEWEKLAARRKALNSLANHKLQQSAEKEIEHASREIKASEETLLTTLEETEILGKQIATIGESLAKQKTAYNEKIKEAKGHLVNLERRNKDHLDNRNLIAPTIDAKNMAVYERAKEKFIMDPLVPIVNNLCSGCNMQIGPQVIVLIGKADSLVRCPGCARILYVTESPEAEAEKNSAV